MANDFTSNFTNKLMRVFLSEFEMARVLSKNVNTQLLKNVFSPSTGETVFFKRPTDYVSTRDPTGDLTSKSPSDIITGKAQGVVQDYITVRVSFDEADQALKMDQLDELLRPAAQRIVTDLEVDFGKFMMNNAGLLAGTFGTAVTTWSDIALASAVMKSTGIPQDGKWSYAMNPHTQVALADVQRSLGAGGSAGDLVKSAHEKAMIASDFAGMEILTSTALASFTTASEGDRVGTVNGAPTPTYLGAKDTMTQAITVAAIGVGTPTIFAGEIIQITGRNRLNLNTRQPILDAAGANVLFTGVVTADVVLSGGGGTLIVAGPGIFESGGAYNTIDTAIGNGDVVTLLGAASTIYQPNLFWHKQAFGIGSVPIMKLFSTDTLGTTRDGLQLRVSKYADGTKNEQTIRFDLRPAYSVLNPFFAGQGWG